MDPQITLKPIDTSLKGRIQAALKDVDYEFGEKFSAELKMKWEETPPSNQKDIDADVAKITKPAMDWFTFAVTQHGNTRPTT